MTTATATPPPLFSSGSSALYGAAAGAAITVVVAPSAPYAPGLLGIGFGCFVLALLVARRAP